MRRPLIIAACIGLAAVTGAQQKGDAMPLLSSTPGQQVNASNGPFNVVQAHIVQQSRQGGVSQLVLDISGEQSWDLLDDPSNTVIAVPLGAGAIMTGIGWDTNLTTVGGSWLSEARFYFDGSDHDLMGLFLTPGVADGFSGSGSYSSGGIIDLTDNGIPDIPVLGDETLYIQLNESFDDVADAVDADWTAGSTLTIVYEGGGAAVPTVGQWGMIFLGVAFLGGVVVVSLRRKPAAVTAD